MPFGLQGVPVTFQHLMSAVLSGMQGLIKVPSLFR
jgi:hypothetical protein